jgi:hypothetical protein
MVAYANVGRADVAHGNCRLGVQLSRAGKPFAAAPPTRDWLSADAYSGGMEVTQRGQFVYFLSNSSRGHQAVSATGYNYFY